MDTENFKSIAESNLSEKYVIKEVKGLHPRIRVSRFRGKYEPGMLENLIRNENKYQYQTVYSVNIQILSVSVSIT